MPHPLDRPIWSALTGRQAHFTQGELRARRFPVEVSPLAAPRDHAADALAALAESIPAGDEVALLEPVAPPAAPGVEANVAGTLLQMIAPTMTRGAGAFDIAPLGDDDAPEMLALATLTRPGPFRARTHELGRFLGIRENGVLAAMAGERLNVDGFHEISAVCTHPDHRGKGYGAALMRAVGDRMYAEGDTPFLHSYASNTTAVALYRSLGFTVRAELLHVVWKKP